MHEVGPTAQGDRDESVTTLADIRHGFRLLCRAPAVTLIAILVTALGVGAATVVYAAVEAVLIEPFPYSHTEALVQIRADFGRGGNSRQDWVSRDDMDDVVRENQSFTALGTYRYTLFNLGGDVDSLPEALYGLYLPANRSLLLRSIVRGPFGASPQRESGHRAQDRNTQMRHQNVPSIQIGAVNLKYAGSNESRKQSGRSSRHGWRNDRAAAQHKPKGYGCQETDRRACPQAYQRPQPVICVVLKLEQNGDHTDQGTQYRDR